VAAYSRYTRQFADNKFFSVTLFWTLVHYFYIFKQLYVLHKESHIRIIFYKINVFNTCGLQWPSFTRRINISRYADILECNNVDLNFRFKFFKLNICY